MMMMHQIGKRGRRRDKAIEVVLSNQPLVKANSLWSP